MKILRFLIVLILAFPNMNLGSCATNTGNPAATFLQSLGFLHAVCSKLTECFIVDLEDCDQGVRSTTVIDTEIGLSSGQFSTFDDVIGAEFENEIEPDFDNGFECVQFIGALDCGSPEVTTAFDQSDPTNFDNVVTLFEPSTDSCAGTF